MVSFDYKSAVHKEFLLLGQTVTAFYVTMLERRRKWVARVHPATVDFWKLYHNHVPTTLTTLSWTIRLNTVFQLLTNAAQIYIYICFPRLLSVLQSQTGSQKRHFCSLYVVQETVTRELKFMLVSLFESTSRDRQSRWKCCVVRFYFEVY